MSDAYLSKLEREFQISKHHLISQKEDNKPPSKALHQNRAIVFIEMLLYNANYLFKFSVCPKWDGAEEPTINNFSTIDDRKF